LLVALLAPKLTGVICFVVAVGDIGAFAAPSTGRRCELQSCPLLSFGRTSDPCRSLGLAGTVYRWERKMNLAKLRDDHQRKLKEYEQHLQHMEENQTKHFRQEGSGPLADITEEIKAEYRRHIETYAAIIAEIDAILGV
jgi:hypothetical protein